MPNKDLLLATLAHIEAHPDQWDQSQWRTAGRDRCGTACCFAGTAALLDGAQWVTNDPDDDHYEYVIGRDHARPWHVETYATEALDLDEVTADVLFHECNSIYTIKEIVADLCAAEMEKK